VLAVDDLEAWLEVAGLLADADGNRLLGLVPGCDQ